MTQPDSPVAIDGIVQAVREGNPVLIDRLMEHFLAEADLPALFALRQALYDSLPGHG